MKFSKINIVEELKFKNINGLLNNVLYSHRIEKKSLSEVKSNSFQVGDFSETLSTNTVVPFQMPTV